MKRMPLPGANHKSRQLLLLSVLGCLLSNGLSVSYGAIVLKDIEATLHGFPALLDLKGNVLAAGDFSQWIEDDHLHVRITYNFKDGRHVEENALFRQKPQLVQDEWTWKETTPNVLYRQFAVDFTAKRATAEKSDGAKMKHWSETLEKITPGQTFAGFGFTLAIKGLRERLRKGEKVEVQAVGFTPKPRVVSVEISYAGLDQMDMSERKLKGERFVIHPKIPKIAKLFVDVPDTRIWLTFPPPPSFLRWEGPLVEPDDSLIRVDLLPGGRSGMAMPAPAAGTRGKVSGPQ